MKLNNLLAGLSVLDFNGNLEEEIQGITYSSKNVKPGFLFAALKGQNSDGFDFIQEAHAKGAQAFLSEKARPANFPGNWIQVSDTRKALALCSANFYSHPSQKMEVIGITGTNGKTTITYLVEEILKRANFIPGTIGTITYRGPKMKITAQRTTPEAPDIQNLMKEMVDQGVSHCLMEVSSHSLDLKRVWGIQFDVVVFTNLSGDHLDYHHSMDEYFEAKKKLFFLNHHKRIAIINADDPWGQKLIPQVPIGVITFGLQDSAVVRGEKYELDKKGIEMEVKYPGGKMQISSSLLGKPNLYNILASIAIAFTLKISPDFIKEGIANLKAIPGRFERIENSLGLNIFVDYAHTDDALRNLLETFHELNPKRIFLVFGAGGGRDKTKRERMGKVAASLADWIFLTSDNPRSEDPMAIIRDVEKGIKNAGNESYTVIPDRKEAIAKALSAGKKGDYILVAGKGHEDYQIFKDKIIHFSDAEVIKEILEQMESK
jgi:UDP-N-acetylmuramoyl-L-alanyl-D-glutamate--2,6-diaminopimelate ligase